MNHNKLAIAIEALALVAMNSGEKPVTSRQICKELGLKLRYTESLMQAFVKAGILKSSRGISGGYSLGRERRKIAISEVHNILMALQDNKRKPSDVSALSQVSAEVMNEIEMALNQALQKITLEEIYDKAVKLRAGPGKIKKTDFVI